MNLITQIDKSGNFIAGELIQTLEYCKSHYCKGKCKKFYSDIFQNNNFGFLTCPNGMSVYVDIKNLNKKVYTCFREKGTAKKDKAKVLNNKSEAYNPLLDREVITQLILQSQEIESIKEAAKNRSFIIENISHEVKKLNGQIREKSENILSTYHLDDDDVQLDQDDIVKIQSEVRSIYLSSCMAISRFMIYDYENNPKGYLKGEPFDCNVYKKFDKIRKIFRNYLKKRIKVQINGTSHKMLKAYPSFEMIPLLIIENAIKYSDADSTVTVSFNEIRDQLIIKIESFGPYIEDQEINRIYEKGYRSKHAKQVSDGSGLGLYFVKLICELHNIDISIVSDSKKRKEHNGTKYAPFIVTLNISNLYDE